jgi:hypothetical protein
MTIRQYLLNYEDLYDAARERNTDVHRVVDAVLESPWALDLLRDLLYSDCRDDIREVIDDLAAEAEAEDVDDEDE